ncbi:hypothetical protein PCASD_10759 [Puccinia coronata f. sp. avenae]|uniref:Uncharacterized protein n=1 Tax=Puccinia coronata f. sp. avenae TaxID=200324 RepID=A0A2N5USZ6_9BASI|nr:hypothetical protein PCASD_10759 [Puccinia coronata f. sp. avenae]
MRLVSEAELRANQTTVISMSVFTLASILPNSNQSISKLVSSAFNHALKTFNRSIGEHARRSLDHSLWDSCASASG